MRIVFRIIAAILFIVFFGFALKNTQEVALRFFFDYEMRGPLVLLLLIFFVSGTAFGILAMTPTVFRYRRELSQTKRSLAAAEKELETERLVRIKPPQPDSVIDA